jgi:hypothetical protein
VQQGCRFACGSELASLHVTEGCELCALVMLNVATSSSMRPSRGVDWRRTAKPCRAEGRHERWVAATPPLTAHGGSDSGIEARTEAGSAAWAAMDSATRTRATIALMKGSEAWGTSLTKNRAYVGPRSYQPLLSLRTVQ